ncbi:MAG: YfcE family phosphodiesterase [Deltaproteobacteria bacterium]|nr:metallophosphoesterase [Deltaproteobacteria bacterium]RLB34735.1 MAG: YfcE family phosphodiesterase [Deltaproteobacteria bacterium]
MKVGVISDTHDNVPNIKRAVEIFKKEKVDMVIHAGDFVAPFSVNPLNEMGIDYLGVFGNNDGEKVGLTNTSKGRIVDPPHIIKVAGKKILITHKLSTPELFAGAEIDLIIYGHNHKKEIKKVGSTLIVNPGECGGWLTGKSTIAIVDLIELSAKIIEI